MSPRPDPPRPTMADVLHLPDSPRLFLLWLMRRDETTLVEALAETGLDEAAGRALLVELIAGRFIQEAGARRRDLSQGGGGATRPADAEHEIWKNLNV